MQFRQLKLWCRRKCRLILGNILASYLSSSIRDKHWRYFMCLSNVSSSPRVCLRRSAQLCAPWRCCCRVLDRTLSPWSKVCSLDRDSSAAASAADTRKGTELDTVITYMYIWAPLILKMHNFYFFPPIFLYDRDIRDLRVRRYEILIQYWLICNKLHNQYCINSHNTHSCHI